MRTKKSEARAQPRSQGAFSWWRKRPGNEVGVKADEPQRESNIIDISFQFSASEVFNISTLVSKLFISSVADGDVWTLGIFPGPVDILRP